jgi:small multidrug resistance pump
MKSVAWILLAILCNVGAQVALKMGSVTEMRWQSFMTLPVFCGAFLYGIAFILTVRIYADHPLSIISPLMAGAIFLLVGLASVLVFSEPLTAQKLAGMALIAVGIGLLSGSN